MSDIQNTKVPTDSFQALASDLMTFVTLTVTAIGDLARVPDASVEEVQTGLSLMAGLGREFGLAFAERGIELSGETVPSAELVESDTEAYNAYDVVH